MGKVLNFFKNMLLSRGGRRMQNSDGYFATGSTNMEGLDFTAYANTTVSTVFNDSASTASAKGIFISGASFLIILAVLGVIVNFITIIALVPSPGLKKPTVLFILNLAFADLMLSLASAPLQASVFINEGWSYSHNTCVVFGLIRYLNIGVSVFTFTAIAINRYVAIMHSSVYKKIYTIGNSLIFICYTWLVAAIFILPAVFRSSGEFSYDEVLMTCRVVEKDGKDLLYYHLIVMIVPSFIFLTCYPRIYWKIRRSQRAISIQSPKSLQHQQQPEDRKKSRILDGFTTVMQSPRKDYHLLRIAAVIFTTFIFCYIPLAVVRGFRLLENNLFVQVYVNVIFYISTCINPFIYVAMSNEYRKAYKNLFTPPTRDTSMRTECISDTPV